MWRTLLVGTWSRICVHQPPKMPKNNGAGEVLFASSHFAFERKGRSSQDGEGESYILLCNGLVLLKTYLLTVIMLAHRPRVSMSPYLFHPLAIVAVVTSKPLATTHAELNNNCKLKLQIHPTRLFYKTHCLDDQQSHQALTLNSFPANLRDCLRQLSIMRNQQ